MAQCRAAGMDGFQTKPVRMDKLQSIITSFAEKRAARRKVEAEAGAGRAGGAGAEAADAGRDMSAPPTISGAVSDGHLNAMESIISPIAIKPGAAGSATPALMSPGDTPVLKSQSKVDQISAKMARLRDLPHT